MSQKPMNILLIGIDSLSARNMSAYGYHRQTTPHIDKFASEGVLFERYYCPSVPTTSGYGSMLTGKDCFGNTLVGFKGNPAAQGFDNYLQFEGWGDWEHRPSRKAENLNDVTLPELHRLAAGDAPFFLFLRHMDPHSPYLPPSPFDRMFYEGNECDPNNRSMDPVKEFKPFWDYFASWLPPGITDAEYVIAQYDGAVAYMDACIQRIFTTLETLGIADNTLVIINSDHGETLMDHGCYFDHHGMYDCTLHVPLIMRLPGRLPAGKRVSGMTQHQDLVPTVMDLLELDCDRAFDGRSMLPMMHGEVPTNYSEFYITECTWMRKHGWRTAEWKLIQALEPDFHFMPEIELYNLLEDPEENTNLANEAPEIRDALLTRMNNWIARREAETGRPNPIYHQPKWHARPEIDGPFTSSQQAFDTLYIGSSLTAAKIQDKEATEEQKDKK